MNSICFDTETTGLHPNGSDPDEILTISIIGRDGSVLLDERFRPTVKTEWPHASAVNGIYPEDVADLPTIETAIPRLREIFAGADEVIGYNVGFDLGFLSAVGVRPREDARITDTMKEFTWFMGRRESDDEPPRWLCVGWLPDGRSVELIAVETIFGWLIIHAMSPVQPKFAKEIAQTERRAR